MGKKALIVGSIVVSCLLVSSSILYLHYINDASERANDGEGGANVENGGAVDNDDDGGLIPVVPKTIDTDGDGIVDSSDAFPYDSSEWKDTDGDGLGDNSDSLPFDKDNDGFSDSVDLYPNSDIGFVFSISKIRIVDYVDLLDEYGEIYFILTIDGNNVGRLDNNGETWSCQLNTQRSVSASFRYNVEDDQRYTNILLTMLDDDLDSDDILDIDGNSQLGRTLALTYDITTQTWTGDDDGVAYGSEDGTESDDDDDAVVYYDIEITSMPQTKSFTWTYGGKGFTLSSSITSRQYAEYQQMDIARKGISSKWVNFVTTDDQVIKDIALKLTKMAQSQGYGEVETINFALRFCQSIEYMHDSETMGADEYWRFPVETLYDEVGDCEDSSFLFASIAEAMGYDAVLLEFDGHAAVGIASSQASGTNWPYSGVRYYMCETTSEGHTVGSLPVDLINTEMKNVIQVH